MSSIGAVGNRYDITINSPSTAVSSSVATRRAENLSFQNLAISSTGHPPGCSCPICSGQRSVSINTTVATNTAKGADFNALATAVTHGAGCTCPICSGKRAMTIKTNVATTTSTAKEANFNALLTTRHPTTCNCPVCSGQRSLSIKTPDKATNSKENVNNSLLNELTNSIKTKQTLSNQESINNRVVIKNADSSTENINISKNKTSIAQDTLAKEVNLTKEAMKSIKDSSSSVQNENKSSIQKAVARNAENITANNLTAKSSQPVNSQSTSSNNIHTTTGTTNIAVNNNTVANTAVNLASNVAPNTNIVSNFAANATTNIASSLSNITTSGQQTATMPSITGSIGNTALSSLTSALSRAANINIPQNRVFAENIAGKAVLAMSSGDKPVKINMAILNNEAARLVLKGKNGQLIFEKEAKVNSEKIVFGENNKSKSTKMPTDLPPMISFNALSNALRSKDINKNNLAKLFMLLTGKFMDEDQITDDLEGMFGVWKDHIKKLREEKERREQKRKDDQQKNKKNRDNSNDNGNEQQSEIASVAA